MASPTLQSSVRLITDDLQGGAAKAMPHRATEPWTNLQEAGKKEAPLESHASCTGDTEPGPMPAGLETEMHHSAQFTPEAAGSVAWWDQPKTFSGLWNLIALGSNPT